MNLISEEDVERALHWLVENAVPAAKARAERHYLEDYAKVLEARIMAEHDNLSAVLQKRHALADDRYLTHLNALREAREIDFKHTFLREAATAKIEAWRTQSATERAMKL